LSARRIALIALALCVPMLAGCGMRGGAMMSSMMSDELPLADAQQVIADMKLGPSGLRVIGAVDRGNRSYRVGETITLSAQVTKNAHLAVLRVLSNGTTTQLYPNKEHPASEVAANTSFSMPVTTDKPGMVLFEFVAAAAADSFLFDKERAKAGKSELGATTRALAKEIVMSLKPGAGREVAGAHVAVKIDAP
jgi:uncharacterized protein DUF4384